MIESLNIRLLSKFHGIKYLQPSTSKTSQIHVESLIKYKAVLQITKCDVSFLSFYFKNCQMSSSSIFITIMMCEMYICTIRIIDNCSQKL